MGEDDRIREDETPNDNKMSSASRGLKNKRRLTGMEESAVRLDPPLSEVAQPTKSNDQNRKPKKVDWTPELHKRFVQAVEQLGLETAVPSRILEIMGIDCLTRHNVASHLQKYRTQRRRSLARESEVARSNERQPIYSGAVPGKPDVNSWSMPTMGFPPANFTPPPYYYVWGHPHPSMHQQQPFAHHTWPWLPPSQPPPLIDHHPYFWYYYSNHHQYIYSTPGMPSTSAGLKLAAAEPSFPIPPWEESVDRAIEDVLTKPWLPLPIGLKPPSVDSVLVELERQGMISKVPRLRRVNKLDFGDLRQQQAM